MAIVIAIYMLANLAYLHVLSIPEIAASDHVGATAAERVLGPAGGTLVAVMILLSIIGSLNGCFLTSPRVYFAQARDGLFFAKFGEVHPRFRTPAFAIVGAGGMGDRTAAERDVRNFDRLRHDRAVDFLWADGAGDDGVCGGSGRNMPRPYRMWGYPVTPLLFLAVAAGVYGNTVFSRPVPSLRRWV